MKKNKTPEIVVYTNNTCVHCKRLKELLNEAEIKFTEKDKIKQAEEWGMVVALTGLPTFPTIVVEDSYFIPGRDYQNPEQIVHYIKNYNPENTFSEELKMREGFKTLIYTINQGFNRVMGELNKLKEDEHKSTN